MYKERNKQEVAQPNLFTVHHDKFWLITQNLIIKSELKCHSQTYKTKEILQQKAISGNPLNINEHEIYLVYSWF